ncbi:MAG TPA: MauE/DoxX family redox-associated membrane protein [Candidatus Acidoferrales bacterium]|nr:MauE/DoxX family redox-associated membrane protein [Candidatus Acidoferrales bacterium]
MAAGAQSHSAPFLAGAGLRFQKTALVYARVALAAAFLSSVADRFGFWGPPGEFGVSWGNWKSFVATVAYMNPFLPRSAAPILSVIVTCLELGLATLLLLGVWRREVAAACSALLFLFATSLAVFVGVKTALAYSVYSASAAALLLALASPCGKEGAS